MTLPFDYLSIIFILLAFIFLVVGVVGAFVPGLPGPPFAWAALLLTRFSAWNTMPLFWLIVMAVVAIVVTVLDYICPSMMTKNGGGSKVATTGCTVGIVVGVLMGGVGILIFPFIGALIGELVNTGNQWGPSLKAATFAFLGFLLGTGLKLLFAFGCIALVIASFFW